MTLFQSSDFNSSTESNIFVDAPPPTPKSLHPLLLLQLEMKLKFNDYINSFFMNEGNKHIFFSKKSV